MTDDRPLRPVIWVGTSRKDLRRFPEPVQDHVGYALYVAQRGGRHRDTKVLSGFGGAGVVEVVKDFRGDTFRAVTRTARGRRVRPPCVSEEVEDRARDTTAGHRDGQTAVARGRADRQGEGVMSRRGYETSSGNVFKDLGVPQAEEHLRQGATRPQDRHAHESAAPHASGGGARCLASGSRTCRRWCGASFGSSRLSGSYGSSWRSIRTSRS